MANMILGLVKYSINLMLRYFFLAVLLVVAYFQKIKNAILSPLEPVAAEARRVPIKDISFRGIIHTLTRLVFLVGLMWWSLVTRIFENLTSPFQGHIEKFMKKARSYSGEASMTKLS